MYHTIEFRLRGLAELETPAGQTWNNSSSSRELGCTPKLSPTLSRRSEGRSKWLICSWKTAASPAQCDTPRSVSSMSDFPLQVSDPAQVAINYQGAMSCRKSFPEKWRL